MAEFTDQDQEFLETLRKAYEKAASTNASRDPWQELFSRETTHEAGRSVLAADVIKGFTGSWAASFSYGLGGSRFTDTPTADETLQGLSGETPTPLRRVSSKLGLRGVPDIDFVPYNWRTNRFGTKGPALVGHPISFEVVGPTLKSPACDWTWDISFGAGPNGGDLLTMGQRFDSGVATCASLLEGYNLADFQMGVNEPNGGLYIMVSDPGYDPGSIPPGFGSIVRDEYLESFPYELFRIASLEGGQIELHPNKSLLDFIIPRDFPSVRAITIVRPYVTRLVAVPNSGAGLGREQTFLVVSPERAAQSDLYPPYNGGTPQDGTWLQGGVPGGGTSLGNNVAYGGQNALPIPKPIDEGVGTLRQNTVPVAEELGVFSIDNNSIPGAVADGRLLNVFDVSVIDTWIPNQTDQILGTYPVTATTGAGTGEDFTMQRVAEVSPVSGIPFFGPGPSVNFSFGLRPITCSYTIHNPISDLWIGDFKADDVDSARLTNLIDPRYVERLEKSRSEAFGGGDPQFAPSGANGGRGDRAIFNTRTEENLAGIPFADDPGNLLNLGFRMVLFPGKEEVATGALIPDFDNPITSREVIIDGSLDPSVKQFIDVDYSAGLVRLSVPPPETDGPGGAPVAPTEIIPNGVPQVAQNERGEVVLYAACVPFSMEPGQLGTGTRITGRLPDSNEDVDAFSEVVSAYIDTNLTSLVAFVPGFGPSAIPGNPVAIVLDREVAVPETGVLDILAGNLDTASYGTWQYNGKSLFETTVNGVVRRHTVLLGPQSGDNASALTPPISNNTSYMVRFRRQARVGQVLNDPTESSDIVQYDTTYGASARPATLRFDNFKPRYELDGSVSLEAALEAQRWQQWGFLAPALYSEVVDDGGLQLEPRLLRSDGFFAEPRRFDEGGLTVTEVVAPAFRLDGNVFDFLLNNAGDLRAVQFGNPLFQGAQEFRLVMKVDYEAEDPVNNQISYLGLLNPSTDPVNPQNVGLAAPALLASDAYMGFRFEGDPQDPVALWQFVVSDGAGNSQVVGIPRLNPRDPYYFIIETERDGYIDPDLNVALDPAPYRIKWAVRDKDLNLVVRDVIKAENTAIPSNVTPMSLFMGTRSTLQGGNLNLRVYYTSAVTRKGLPGPKF